MVPIEVACLASTANYKLFVPALVERFFGGTEEHFTWSFAYKCRNNNKFLKGDFFDFLTPLIPKNYSYLTYNGDMTFMLDITQHLMCISVFNDFDRYKKYSFMSLLAKEGKEADEAEEEGEKEGEQKTDGNRREDVKVTDLELHDVKDNPNEDISMF